jgi:hypothetical protein
MTLRLSAVAVGAVAIGLSFGAAIGSGGTGAAADRSPRTHAVPTLVVLDPATGRTMWSGPASAAPAKIVVLDPSTGKVIRTLTPTRQSRP